MLDGQVVVQGPSRERKTSDLNACALVGSLVALHGGTIEVTLPRKPTTLTITIPERRQT
ncbi:MAG: hypothetical protein ACK5MR_00980 [Cumulibacter sp.]